MKKNNFLLILFLILLVQIIVVTAPLIYVYETRWEWFIALYVQSGYLIVLFCSTFISFILYFIIALTVAISTKRSKWSLVAYPSMASSFITFSLYTLFTIYVFLNPSFDIYFTGGGH